MASLTVQVVKREISASPLAMKCAKHGRDTAARVDNRARAADQGKTWQHVGTLLNKSGAHSDTDSLLAAMDMRARQALGASQGFSREEHEGARRALEGAQGLAVRRKDGWIALDLFGTTRLAERGVPMALESVELETGTAGRPWETDPAKVQKRLKRGLASLADARWVSRAEGPAVLVDFTSKGGLRGTSLVFDGVVLQTTLTWAQAA